MDIDFLAKTVETYLPARKKRSPSGWISFNAPCCHNRGESSDTRGRGGMMFNANGTVSYHCFNCQYKTSFTPGRPISYKFRKLLSWLGVDENTVKRLVIDAIRLKEIVGLPDSSDSVKDDIKVEFPIRSLPNEAVSFLAYAEFQVLGDRPFPENFVRAVDYVYQRKIDMQEYDFYWTPEVEQKLSHRVIVPFYYKNQIVGYTARAIEAGILPKYFSNHEANFVFNLDKQTPEKKFVIVTEGVFDAMCIDGVAVLSNTCSEQQADLIDNLAREVIVVPDFDQHLAKTGRCIWPGKQLIETAIEYGWTVSFPIWHDVCKDVNDAVTKYGKLFVLKSILAGRIDNKLKIQLMTKKLG